MIIKTKKPIINMINSDEIITEKTAKINRRTITEITKNIKAILIKKSRMKVGFSSLYINLNPRLNAEIPRDAVQNNEITENERNLSEFLKKISSNIFLAASKDASGKKERKTFIISYSDTDANSFISEINSVIKGIAEIRI